MSDTWLHRDDYPNTLRLLAELFAGRTDFDRLGYHPDANGALVDWYHMVSEAPISSTEVALVHIARGCSILERHGGLARLADTTVDTVARTVQPVRS